MLKIAVLILGVVAVPECVAQRPGDPLACPTSDAAKAICAIEARLTEALRRNDVDRLAEIYADDFQLINYRGTRITRSGILGALRAGTLRFDSIATSEVDVRIHGATVVVTGRQFQIAREPGRDEAAHPAYVRFSHVYVLSGEQWHLVSSQNTPILAPAPDDEELYREAARDADRFHDSLQGRSGNHGKYSHRSD
jgi:uncharacterized protein (TIGR02246 family)